MREILLYDPKRVPSQWTGLIQPGQYAAFLSDVQSSAPMSSDGSAESSASKHSCLLFESLPEAEAYCHEAVQKIPDMKCDVFDSAGRVNPPVAVFVNQKFAHTLDTEARAHRLILWGLVAIAVSVPLFWYAWKSGASEVWWPILLGINVLFAGLRLLHWGSGLKEQIRYRQEQAALRLQQNAGKKDSK
jgi:hypothetical protein